MDYVNEFGIEPGVYQHHRGDIYVVTGVLTHVEGPEGRMIEMSEPMVLFRDAVPIAGHDSTGKPTSSVLRIYGHKLSEFKMDMEGTPRFKKV